MKKLHRTKWKNMGKSPKFMYSMITDPRMKLIMGDLLVEIPPYQNNGYKQLRTCEEFPNFVIDCSKNEFNKKFLELDWIHSLN